MNFLIEKVCILLVFLFFFVGVVVVICYGWVFYFEIYVVGLLVLVFLIGFCVIGFFLIFNIFFVDLYFEVFVIVVVVMNFVRCFFGVGGMVVIEYMLRVMGRGWIFIFWGLVFVLFFFIFWVLVKWGFGW